MSEKARIRQLALDKNLPKLDTRDFRAALGDLMPIIEPSPVGRMRLMRSLRSKFGTGFKNIKQAKDLMKQFDDTFNDRKEFVLTKGKNRGK